MLRSIAPKLSRVAILVNPTKSVPCPVAASLPAAAQSVDLEIGAVGAATAQQIEGAFAKMSQQNAGAVIVVADAFFIQEGQQIAELARKHRMPSVFPFREQVDAGGLMSYGQHLADNFRRAATYVDKIFEGAKPADLPVEESTKLELVINLRTAEALDVASRLDCWCSPPRSSSKSSFCERALLRLLRSRIVTGFGLPARSLVATRAKAAGPAFESRQ